MVGSKETSTAKIDRVKEKSIESYLFARIKLCGGFCIKLNANWYVGIPDRLVVFKRHGLCVVAFVELKRPAGGRLSVAQKWWKKKLTELGVEWHLISTRKEVDDFVF